MGYAGFHIWPGLKPETVLKLMDTKAIRHGLHHKAWWIPLNCSLYLKVPFWQEHIRYQCQIAPLRLSEDTFPISH